MADGRERAACTGLPPSTVYCRLPTDVGGATNSRGGSMQLHDLAADALARHRTTPGLVADVLREAILTGILKAGQPLRQEDISAQFGLSRSPVREALRQLEGEGLVKLYPHRGAVVAEFPLSELWELCEIRIPLETTAIRLAMPHLTA